MDRQKASSYINIAHKAGYLLIGSDSLRDYTQKLYLVLVDSNAGKFAQKIATNFASNGIKMKVIDDLAGLASIKSCSICGVKNKKLSECILENL